MKFHILLILITKKAIRCPSVCLFYGEVLRSRLSYNGPQSHASFKRGTISVRVTFLVTFQTWNYCSNTPNMWLSNIPNMELLYLGNGAGEGETFWPLNSPLGCWHDLSWPLECGTLEQIFIVFRWFNRQSSLMVSVLTQRLCGKEEVYILKQPPKKPFTGGKGVCKFPAALCSFFFFGTESCFTCCCCPHLTAGILWKLTKPTLSPWWIVFHAIVTSWDIAALYSSLVARVFYPTSQWAGAIRDLSSSSLGCSSS